MIITLLLNAAVSLAKLAAGWHFRSLSITADGFHSFFDASSNIIGLVGVKVASLPPDESHPYGHKKYETFAALGIGVMLVVTCVELVKRAYGAFVSGEHPAVVSWEGFAVMGGSVAVNLFVSSYEARKGREYGSDFLLADSGHTRSDIFASVSVIAGMAAIRLGYPIADPLVTLFIALLIARVGYGIIKASSDILCDAARIRTDEVVDLCMGVEGVKRCHHVRSRGRQDEICIDLRVHVDPGLSAAQAHEIAHRVEERIRGRITGVYDVIVHIEPEE